MENGRANKIAFLHIKRKEEDKIMDISILEYGIDDLQVLFDLLFSMSVEASEGPDRLENEVVGRELWFIVRQGTAILKSLDAEMQKEFDSRKAKKVVKA